MKQTAAKLASNWLVRAGVPTLAVAGLATYYSHVSNDAPAPSAKTSDSAQRLEPQATQRSTALSESPLNQPQTPPEMEATSAAPQVAESFPLAARQPDLPSVASLVRVYYATDRNAADLRSQIPWLSGVLPLCVAIVATFGMIGIAPSYLKRTWPLVAAGGLLIVSFLGHSVWIRTATLFKMSHRYHLVFGSQRYRVGEHGYPLHLGYCDVTIPPSHTRGRLESPSWIRMEWKQDERKHVILQSIKPDDESSFFKNLASRLNSSPTNEALVFIHGYNVPFADAVRRTAQLHHDLAFPGAPICYSWPSTGTLMGYSQDEAAVGWTVAHLEKFLVDIHEKSGAQKIHLIAHSMGNRALVGALERLVLRDTASQKWLGQIVMAAPDIDSGELSNRYIPTIANKVERITLYSSQNDKALLASATLHGATRAGYQDASQLLFQGVETIDVSSIDTGLLGHSYYGEHPDLIKDLQALIELNRPAKLRDWLSPIQVNENQGYWVFLQKKVANQQSGSQPSNR